jgi:hypothetical protein
MINAGTLCGYVVARRDIDIAKYVVFALKLFQPVLWNVADADNAPQTVRREPD